MATFTTARGYHNLTTVLASMVDWDYTNFIDYDDETRYDLATFMMTKGNSQRVDTPEFFAWAGELNPRTGQLGTTTAMAAASTEAFIPDTDGIRVDDVLHFPVAGADGEHVRVTAIAAGTSVGLNRLNETPTTIATRATFIILGSASSELSSSSIAATWMEPVKVTNRVQLIRRSFELSRTETDTAVQTSQSRLQQKTEQTRMDFRLDLGHTFWFSLTSSTYASTFMTSKGINEQLVASGNVIDAGGALVYKDFTDTAQSLAIYSKSRKYVVFHGRKMLGGFANELQAGTSYYRTKSGDGKFGSSGNVICVSDFEFALKYERIFDVIGAPYNAMAFFIDMDALTCHHLGPNGKFEFRANIHDDPGGEIVKSQFRAHVGLGLTWPKRHAMIHGIT